jgi:hypothetical protein
VASLVPKQTERVTNSLAEFSDEELEQLRAYLESVAEDEAAGRPAIRTIRTPEKRAEFLGPADLDCLGSDQRPPDWPAAGKSDKSGT